MIADVHLYHIPGSVATGEYPIMTEGQDLSSYLIHTIENAKVTRDLLQSVGPVEVFEGCEDVNLARIGSDWYWVTSWSTQSLQRECIVYGLVYNAPTSQLRLNGSLRGVFARTPAMTRPYLTMAISNDAMAASRHIDLPNLGTYKQKDNSQEDKLYWCELLATGTSSSSNSLHRFGFFAAFDPVTMLPSGRAVRCGRSGDSEQSYPTINRVIADPEIFGVQADQIIQIAVSERCPYEVSRGQTSTGYNTVYFDGVGKWQVGGYWVYTNNRTYWGGEYWPESAAEPEELTLTLSDMERTVGSVRIITESGSAVATVPTQYGDTITLQVRTIDDYTGLNTELIYNGRVLCSLNEGHLPWIGDAWLQYQARQMEYDRAMTAAANNQSRADLDISLRQSELNQVMTQINALSNVGLFNPGSWIGAGLGIIEADIKGREERDAMEIRSSLEISANNMKQRLTEKMVKAEPGTAYSMGYGTIYLTNTYLHPARVQVEMPANLTAEYFDDFVSEFGWPAEGLQTITLTPGYIQGQPVGSAGGVRADELARVLASGFKMRVIT